MLFFYDLGIRCYGLLLFILAPFNEKARLWTGGRRNLLKHIAEQVNSNEKCCWFHFPSLGEFEQGRPVLEEMRKKYPGKKVIITFFSPSGYTIRKNYEGADHVFYLPADTELNAREFIRLINPELVVFTKYDYWFHYFRELKNRQVPLYVISAIFNKDQPFFKWYGSLHRQMLGFITCVFVQNEASRTLLETIGRSNAIVSGDTRFDRVASTAASIKRFPEIEEFITCSKVFIGGSTWAKDEEMIKELTNQYPEWKFIIAPHEIHPSRIKGILQLFEHTTIISYSEWSQLPHNGQLSASNYQPQVLLIDNIGILSSLYQYGTVAYIGGGFGTGLHNTLEAAAFNLPVIFGPEYDRFKEAKDLVDNHAAFSYRTAEELYRIILTLVENGNHLEAGRRAGEYVRRKTGATDVIVKSITRPGG